ncbi:hypothetical protein EDC01DRAFT_776851 [Geopyxis carbonaria]|nr:hypothetical protein EDC01DRAFT_776851 [Geopyxis carbonaria]
MPQRMKIHMNLHLGRRLKTAWTTTKFAVKVLLVHLHDRPAPPPAQTDEAITTDDESELEYDSEEEIAAWNAEALRRVVPADGKERGRWERQRNKPRRNRWWTQIRVPFHLNLHLRACIKPFWARTKTIWARTKTAPKTAAKSPILHLHDRYAPPPAQTDEAETTYDDSELEYDSEEEIAVWNTEALRRVGPADRKERERWERQRPKLRRNRPWEH